MLYVLFSQIILSSSYFPMFSLVVYEIFFYLCQNTVLRYRMTNSDSSIFHYSCKHCFSTLDWFTRFQCVHCQNIQLSVCFLLSEKPCLLHFFSCLVSNICFHSYHTAHQFASKVFVTEKFLQKLKVLEIFSGIFGN